MDHTTDRPADSVSTAVLLLIVTAIGIALLAAGGDYPALHTILDTSMALLPAMLALLFWDMGVRSRRGFKKWLAIGFAIVAVLNLIHLLVAIEWAGPFAFIAKAGHLLRPATWPPSTHLLPIGTILAIRVAHRNGHSVRGFALGMTALAAALFAVFQILPYYTQPVLLGITRPSLIAAPLLWAVAFVMAWRRMDQDRVMPPIAVMSFVLMVGNGVMLYSVAPHDNVAMVAHLARVCGFLTLILSLMRMATLDMQARIRAETRLAGLNEELEQRVLERTEQLQSTNVALESEILVRRQAEEKAQAQLGRLNLLQQITHAIGERQDLHSIFQVVVRTLEDQLPVDFCCLCLYDATDQVLIVTRVGVKSDALALDLAMTEQARVEIDENGLSSCLRGKVVYEADIGDVKFPFPQRLARGGLRSLVIAPLQVESQVFGILVTARRTPNSFSSGECEFLRQLSEHVALASHQAQLHGALQQAYDDLRQTQQAVMQQERLRALGQMASGIAHDINNALSPVSLYTESLLETEADLSPRARGYLETIQRAVDDVAHTVARMKEFYRQRAPQLTLLPVALNPLVEQVIDLTRARWSDMSLQRGMVVHVRTDLAADLPPVLGVESEIREALINLILNAIDAMPNGGTVTLRTRHIKPMGGVGLGTAQIEIVDTGVGMDEETRRRCLEPFFTTKGERGTGLGLAMVYGVMRRHSAEIDIDSVAGQGTTMRLQFPVPAVTAAPDKVAYTGLVIPSRLRLLLIDDDPLLLKSLGDTLEADGHVVVAANDGPSGIATFRAAHASSDPFALVITDLGMPNMDGRKVAMALKETSPSTPVILLTGWGQRLLSEDDIPPHVDRVLSKPPKLREVREALAQHCPADKS